MKVCIRNEISLAILLLASLNAVVAAAPKRVLIVHSFGLGTPPFTTHSIAFETELTEKMGEQVDLDEVSLDMTRFADDDMQEALVDYLNRRHVKWQPDLVVPIGSPAGVFVAQYRERLFPNTPILYTGMDRRRLPDDALQKNAAFIGESFDLPAFVDDILQIAPGTTNIAMVIGASPVERYWKAAFHQEFAPFTNRVSFTWLDDLPFDQMLERVRTLPPRSFVFLILLLRDASGVTHNADEALKRIHAVANAPVNGIFQHQLGMGIVGGRLYQAELEGEESARIAVRILHGESATNFLPKIIGPLSPRYDWRELKRWKISKSQLPPGSEVRFRAPTFWEQYKWQSSGILCVVLGQGAIVVVLVRSLLRGQRLTRELKDSESQLLQGRAELKDQLRFERLGTDISSMLMDAPAEGLGQQIVPALEQMAQLLGFEAATLWLWTGKDAAHRAYGWHKPGMPGLPSNLTNKDFPWSARELFAGRDVRVGALDDFPPEAQTDRATSERFGLKSMLAVPIFVSSHPVGVLSMGSFQEELSVSPQLIQRQRVLGNLLGNALVRARAEIGLRESEKRLTLAATAGDLGLWLWNLQTNVLWATERARKMFGFSPESELTYEAFYGRVHPEDRPAVNAGMAAAISSDANYDAEYRICLPDGAEKWIAARGEVAFEDGDRPVSMTGIVSDITERKQAEQTTRELSGRLIRAQEEERTRLARELHDDITQRLARLAIDAGRIESGGNGTGRTETMREVRDGLVRLSNDVHSLSYRLHPSILEDLGLADGIRAECERFSRQESIPVELKLEKFPGEVTKDAGLCLFRVTQEALRNVARHARAKTAEVSLRPLDGGLQLAVTDNGIGFDPGQQRQQPSLGLASMRERVHLLGGELDIESAPGHGTSIVAWIPLRGEVL